MEPEELGQGNRQRQGCSQGRAQPGGRPRSTSATTTSSVAAMSMMTVPETTGVKMPRTRAMFAPTWKWTIEETTMRLAMSGGPPSSSAVTQTAMNAPGAHDEDVPRADVSDADGLEHGRRAAHEQGGEGDVGVGLSGDAGHDRDGDYDGGDDHKRGLQAGAQRERDGQALVRLIANAGFGGPLSPRSTSIAERPDTSDGRFTCPWERDRLRGPLVAQSQWKEFLSMVVHGTSLHLHRCITR